jgi:AcrR family transcriptional regulator
VLAEAEALVDAEGPDALTLARLAARLDIRIPSLYNHIAGLDDLQRALAARAAGQLAAAMRAAAVGRSGAPALLALGNAYRDYVKAHPGRYTLLARTPAGIQDSLAPAINEPAEVAFAVLAASEIRGEEAVHLVRGLRSAVHGFATLETAGGFAMAVDVDESFHRLMAAVIHGLRGSLAG